MTRPAATLLVALASATGCFKPPSPPTVVPMRQIRSAHHRSEAGTRCLVVFLPGYGNTPEDLLDRGFVTLFDEERVDADATVVDAHVGYYLEHTILARLDEDVIGPRLQEGYDRIWLVAISMGALGALGYASQYPENVAGVILLSPWLGTDDVLDEITDAGGIRRWRRAVEGHLPTLREGWREDIDPIDFFHIVWAFAASPVRSDGSRVPIYLGYSSYDRFGEGQELLATAIPERQVLRGYGPHHFSLFLQLFRGFVEEGPIQRSCRPIRERGRVVSSRVGSTP